MKKRFFHIALTLVLVAVVAIGNSFAASVATKRYSKSKTKKVTESASATKKISRSRHSRTVATTTKRTRRGRRHRYYERFTASSFTNEDQAASDVVAGEDPAVRAAALEALGNMNGTVVAIDPNTGRILAMVNQDLALSEGATPCSTIKLSVALTALSEGIITKDTKINLGGGYKMDLTQALAHSNNTYFEILGRQLGFEKVSTYAHQFGLGELAG